MRLNEKGTYILQNYSLINSKGMTYSLVYRLKSN